MAISLRSLAAVLALPLIALSLAVNLGFYTLPSMLAVLAAGILVVAACLLPERELTLAPRFVPLVLYLPALATVAYLIWLTVHETNPLKAQFEAPLAASGGIVLLLAYLARRRPAHPLHGLLIGVGILLTGVTALAPQLRFGAPENPALSLQTQLVLLASSVLMFLVWLSFLADPVGRAAGPDPLQANAPRRGWWVRWGLLLVAGVAMRVGAVSGSPDPVIDVNAWLQNAPRFLLEGRNPYASDYPSPYGTERARRMGINDAPNPRPPVYPPTAILTGLPAVLLGLDVRWVNVLAEIAAAVLLLAAGLRRGGPQVALLASGLYLCLPRAAFMMEQAWFEPQLAALLGLVLWAAPGRPWLAGVALGGFVAAKQYAVALLPSLVRSLGRSPRILWVAAAVAVATSAPFALWGPGDFWQQVVAGHLGRPVVYHALTIAALLHNVAGLTVPAVVLWTLAAALLGLLAWKTPAHEERGGGLGLAAALLVFCLCHTQGFPNYYYLALFLLLLGLAQERAETARAISPAQSPPA